MYCYQVRVSGLYDAAEHAVVTKQRSKFALQATVPVLTNVTHVKMLNCYE